MGSTVQWRGENERDPHRYGKTISFGNLRDRGTAYMSYSDRVGPGIIVLGASDGVCDRLTREGFTALAPRTDERDEEKTDRLLDAAVDFLADNWHPRVGVLACGDVASLAESLAERKRLDAVVVLGDEDALDDEVIDAFRYDLS